VLAESVGWSATTIVLIVALVAIQQSTRNPTRSAIFTHLAPSGAVYLLIGGYLLRRLRPVPQYVQQPSPGLGRWARGDLPDEAGSHQHVDGFIVEVALGIALQVLADGTRGPTFVPLQHAAKLTGTHRPLCRGGCERWIPPGERGLREQEVAERDRAVHGHGAGDPTPPDAANFG